MSKEAMKLAIEAADELEWMLKSGYEQGREGPPRVHRLIGKIKALAQPAQQQERMAWVYDTGKGYKIVGYNSAAIAHLDHGTLLVPNAPQPAQRKPLTDEQIEELCWTELDRRLLSFARAIEAAHGIKGDA